VIESNDVLTNFDGLQKLSEVAGAITITFNESLTNFCGLQLEVLVEDTGHMGGIYEGVIGITRK
jgi:hypothetical protein